MTQAHLNLIDGIWTTAESLTENCSPANPDDLVGLYARGGTADVDGAVAAAKAAQPGWAKASKQLRADVLRRAGDMLLARAEEMARLLAREEGKTLEQLLI